MQGASGRRGAREGRWSQCGRRKTRRESAPEGDRRRDLDNEDQSDSRPSNRSSAMKTDIILDRRASIIVELSGVVEVEARLPGPES